MYNGTMKRGKIMTRDKAIEEVKNYENYPNGLSKECRDYIVKELEQVPSSLENPISSTTKNGTSNRTILYKAKKSKDIQEDIEKLEKLNEPTTKTCETCRHYGLHHEICNYCYKCSLWKEKEPTTKNNLAISSGLEKNSKKLEKDFGESDCVDRQAVIDELKRYFHDEYYQRTSIRDCRDCFIEDVLNHLPSVTPQPKKGHWMDTEFKKLKECSLCHARWGIYSIEEFDFCPSCGADMREVKE